MQRVPIHKLVKFIEGCAASLDLLEVLLEERAFLPDEADGRVSAELVIVPDDVKPSAVGLRSAVST